MRGGGGPIEVDGGFVAIVGFDFRGGVVMMIGELKVGMDETGGMVMVGVAGMDVGEGRLEEGGGQEGDTESYIQAL